MSSMVKTRNPSVVPETDPSAIAERARDPETAPSLPSRADSDGPEQTQPHPLGHGIRVIELILVFAGVYVAKPVLLPLVLAFLLAFLLRPLIRLMTRHGASTAVSAFLVILAVTACLTVGAIYLRGPFQEWMARLPDAIHSVRGRIHSLSAPLAPMSEASKAVESLTNSPSAVNPAQVEVKGQSWSMWLLSGAQDVSVTILATLFALYFILATGDSFLQRVIAMIPGLIRDNTTDNLVIGSGHLSSSETVLAEMERMVFTYLGTITAINVLLGLCLAIATYLLGMSSPLLWGAMACVLNFLPYVGPLLGMAILAVVSLVTFDDVARALWPPATYAILIAIESNVITPMALGRRLAMNSLAIFMWLLVMGWLWGIPGALIAVPLLMVIKIVTDRIRTLRWISLLIEP